jgi:hypothetical protein
VDPVAGLRPPSTAPPPAISSHQTTRASKPVTIAPGPIEVSAERKPEIMQPAEALAAEHRGEPAVLLVVRKAGYLGGLIDQAEADLRQAPEEEQEGQVTMKLKGAI